MTDAEDYRARLRAWLRDNCSAGELDEQARRDVARRMYDAGLAAPTWPKEYGGGGHGADFQTVYNEETAAYLKAPPDSSVTVGTSSVTVGICAPTILDFGTKEQKAAYLPAMLREDAVWTQLLSEPGAGSDLAGVSTRAALDGDEWVINGQKVWTSAAAESDYAIALVRTDVDVPKHQGLSMIVVDLKAPGVDIRPLREMTGESLFNEVFLDDVRVPRENILGEVNQGWAVLSRMLFHERMALSAGTSGARMDRDSFSELTELARRGRVDQRPEVRSALAELFVQQRLLDFLGRRIRKATDAGLSLGPVGSIGKIGTARSARLSAEAALLIAGTAGQAWLPEDSVAAGLARDLLFFPMTGIAGGTTEIQKNVVAERVLGLPREERPDRDLPFRRTKREEATS